MNDENHSSAPRRKGGSKNTFLRHVPAEAVKHAGGVEFGMNKGVKCVKANQAVREPCEEKTGEETEREESRRSQSNVKWSGRMQRN